jgi:pyruvate/2-oxoglutarate dehydrogenase complex dihydrolipoamide dehydrogenase (E3) component
MVRTEGVEMDYDVIVIGAGAAGEAAGSLGAELGGRVAVVERDLVGGLCSFWACMPSKTLLDSAARRGLGVDYPWKRASERRDWMISREGIDYPDDSSHVKSLESAGAAVFRGSARITGPGQIEVQKDGESDRTLEAQNLILCVGSTPLIPAIDGLKEGSYWTSNEGTALRELPSSIMVMGGGPVGVELAQVYARFGVKTVLVQGGDRILPRDHPKSAEILADQLQADGVEIRTGVQATRVSPGSAGRKVELSDGSVVETAQILMAVGRRPADLRGLGVEEAGGELNANGAAEPDNRMRIGEGMFVAGDCAGGLQFTHLADYEGRIAIRSALGQNARADLSAVPKTTFTDPETSSVGLTIDEAWYKGMDAFEITQDFATTARGYAIEPRRASSAPILEGSPGHVTAVIDRAQGLLVGAFAACPGAAEFIHEAVLAIKQRVPVKVLADTIHAFPTGGRVFGNLMADALKRLS